MASSKSTEAENYGRMNVLQERGRDAVNVRPHDTGRSVPMLTHPTLEQRFWSKVNFDGPVPRDRPELGACWLWTASCHPSGHGQFNVHQDGETVMGAHRWAFRFVVGCLPRSGLVLDHLCFTPACVNPSHLEPVTPRLNTVRGTSPPAHHAAQEMCSRGHQYTDGNTYIKPSDGSRDCRICRKMRWVRWTQRHG